MRSKFSDCKYGMKAAPLYPDQMADRVDKFAKLGIDPVIELYLFGVKDVFDPETLNVLCENCKRFNAEYYVHFPVQDAEGYGVFDPAAHSDAYFEKVLDFSRKIGAKGIIMHRIFGIGILDNKEKAVQEFNARLMQWGRMAYPLSIYLENYSFIWLPGEFKQDYVTSPLDHFFPWEITETIKFINDQKMQNISVLVDIAHAVISANMFNLLKSNSVLRKDRRFSNIFAQDLARAEHLSPKDFLVDGIASYFHVSDSFIWGPADSLNDLDRYLYSEGLPIGKGNIDFVDLFSNVPERAIMMMEIVPENGSHANNMDQLRAVEWFKLCKN